MFINQNLYSIKILFNNKMDRCDVDENGQIIDPISLDIIAEKDLISFRQNGKIFCFDINTLYEWNKNRVVKENPLTRQQLDQYTIDTLLEYSILNNNNKKLMIDIESYEIMKNKRDQMM